MTDQSQNISPIGAVQKRFIINPVLVVYFAIVGLLSVVALMVFRPAPGNIVLGLIVFGAGLAIVLASRVHRLAMFAIMLGIVIVNIFWMPLFMTVGAVVLFLSTAVVVFGKNIRTFIITILLGLLALGLLWFIFSIFSYRGLGYGYIWYLLFINTVAVVLYCVIQIIRRSEPHTKIAILGASSAAILAVLLIAPVINKSSLGGWKIGSQYNGLPKLVFEPGSSALISKAAAVPCPGKVQICPNFDGKILKNTPNCIVRDFQSACIDQRRGRSFLETTEASNRRAIDTQPFFVNPLGSYSSPTSTASYSEYENAKSMSFIADPPTYAEGELVNIPMYIALDASGKQTDLWTCSGAGDMNGGPNHQRTTVQFELSRGFATLWRTFVFMNGELDCQILDVQNYLTELSN